MRIRTRRWLQYVGILGLTLLLTERIVSGFMVPVWQDPYEPHNITPLPDFPQE